MLVVEVMPEWLKASHKAARNWGVYPHNGAQRYQCDEMTAEYLTEDDEYNHIVENANPEHYQKFYDTVL